MSSKLQHFLSSENFYIPFLILLHFSFSSSLSVCFLKKTEDRCLTRITPSSSAAQPSLPMSGSDILQNPEFPANK
ncbi:hypothetical protein AQUCO_02000616v1 [Aquilegia coerulea]|uniref:Uncharacterized protein n=1 Tax=Aquilegia coerulea TaxID=218851 RepID=A0A2G5DIK4_AQUCA|nr:hypothetical protein AQUCO_02000616v1 [Aquilegia coerulea]